MGEKAYLVEMLIDLVEGKIKNQLVDKFLKHINYSRYMHSL